MEQLNWVKHLSVNYGTLTVCQQGLTNPFNAWTQALLNQGFAWRPQSVCFATLESNMLFPRIEVALQDSYVSPPDALRIIRVPFQVTPPGIEITSPVSESWLIELSSGDYDIYFAHETDPNGSEDEPWLYRLTFVKVNHIIPAKIVHADDGLTPPDELDMSAEPA